VPTTLVWTTAKALQEGAGLVRLTGGGGGQANGVRTHRRRPARLVAEKSSRKHHEVSTCVGRASASSPRSMWWPGRQFFGRQLSFRNRRPPRHRYVSFTSRPDAAAATAWLLACMTSMQPHWQMGGWGEMKRGRWLPRIVRSASRDSSQRPPQWPSAPLPTGRRRTLLAVPAGLEGVARAAKRPLVVPRTRWLHLLPPTLMPEFGHLCDTRVAVHWSGPRRKMPGQTTHHYHGAKTASRARLTR